jgi:hypothetical protein
MLMALLLFAWTWDRVLTDCQGRSETTSHYYFQATMRETGMGSCPTGQGSQTEPCLIVVPAPPLPFGPNIGDPGTGTTVSTWVDPVAFPDLLPQPPVGGLAAWPWPTADNPNPVVSVDRAGNRCTDTCR